MNEIVRKGLLSAHKNGETGIKKPIIQKHMFSCQPSAMPPCCISVGLKNADFVS